MSEKQRYSWKQFLKERKLVDPEKYWPKNALYAGLWDNNKLKNKVKEKLLEVANNFWRSLEVENIDIEDIVVTGSIANYNWTDFSDIDLHIIVDSSEIPFDKDLVGDFFRAKSGMWNRKHDIFMAGHQVEVYIQDSSEAHYSTGVYSVQNDQWITEPVPPNSSGKVEIDNNSVLKKAEALADQIERAEDFLKEKNYALAYEFSEKLKEKIRNFRKSGLEKGGEYSDENLAFKILRNSEYLSLLDGIYIDSYDKMMSLNGNYAKKLRIFVNNDPKSDQMKLNEIEKYQKKIRSRHSRMKKRLIGFGKQNNSSPYSSRPNYKRSKSAPVGFGGT